MGSFSISFSMHVKYFNLIVHKSVVLCRYIDYLIFFVTAALHVVILIIFSLHFTLVWACCLYFYQNQQQEQAAGEAH